MENIQVLDYQDHYFSEYTPFLAKTRNYAFTEFDQGQLVFKLQTSLEIDQILSIYFYQIEHYLPLKGFKYQLEQYETKKLSEKLCQHQFAFTLNIEQEYLGTVTYQADKKLTLSQIKFLETCHQLLVFPLRNAILFYKTQQLALRDSLTGLGNRGSFDDELARLCKHSKRYNTSFSLFVLDLDKFKQVNDRHGHRTGDMILETFSEILKQSLRGNDSIFRLGGDEFTVLLDSEDQHVIPMITARIHHLINTNQIMLKFNVSTSIGCAHFTKLDSPESLYERADKALYHAKDFGRNCTKIA